ncbi:hypothetical protein GDO78_009795 [Eleutherodactylus coqui]|nr:hypothetical protein GDO78_009795 [Eleutherodactylus coqui]
MCDLNTAASRPQLITMLQDCDYTFLWVTAYACPLTESTHDECRVSNPASGYQFNLASLTSKAGYRIEDRERSIQLNICSDINNSSCGSGVGVCVSQGGKYINAGKSQKRISYVDQMLKLSYEDGDQCDKNPLKKHRSIFTFVCAADTAAGRLPSLTSYIKDTCTWEFSWHTHLACEQEIKCSVKNGTSLIDLSPLIKRVGYYEVLQSTEKDGFSDFYINICQPLNDDVNVKCPPGASVCKATPAGETIDIGRPSGAPQIDQTTQTVTIRMDSRTQCDSSGYYSTTILFHCSAGTDLGRPKFAQFSECNYLFEWDTPLVCPDKESVSGCSLTDQQLQYTFNFSSLSKEPYHTPGPNPYYIGVCAPAQNVPTGKCSGAVCLQSGNTAVSFGNANAMKMEYRHQDNMVLLQYVGGDPCPPVTEDGVPCRLPFTYKGKTYNTCTTEDRPRLWCATAANPEKTGNWGYCSSATDIRQSTILFRCDENSGKGSPELQSVTKECSALFEWKTQLACLPRKLDCKFIFNHQTYDLRMLSSMTGSWDFIANGDRYYLNLCQSVNKGPSSCSETASVCRESKGEVQVLGQVHTQTVTLQDKAILVTYSNGEFCNNGRQRFSTTINLICKNITGKPVLEKQVDIGKTSDDENQYQGLSGRSQAVGAILSILLVILVACLVINTEEEADNETEWLMEEVSANHGKPHHENGHVKSVKAGAFTSLHVDDLDSEDEVLTVPEVRIQSARNKQRNSKGSLGQYASGSDENLIGIANGGQEQTGKSRSGPRKKEDKLNIASFHDDSDEDMLNV